MGASYHDRIGSRSGVTPPQTCSCCGRGALPTTDLGAGAGGPGASATLDPNSTNMAGNLQLHTGDRPDPTANARICSIIFDPGTPFAGKPFVVMAGVDEETEEHIDRIFVKQAAGDAAHFEIWSGDVPLEENEDYSINWIAIGPCIDRAPPSGGNT